MQPVDTACNRDRLVAFGTLHDSGIRHFAAAARTEQERERGIVHECENRPQSRFAFVLVPVMGMHFQQRLARLPALVFGDFGQMLQQQMHQRAAPAGFGPARTGRICADAERAGRLPHDFRARFHRSPGPTGKRLG